MIADRSANTLQAVSFVVQGALLAFILVFVSLVPVHIGSVDFRLTFLPLIAVVIWPDKASYTWSVICLFCIGLLRDVIGFGPSGVWALTYLIVFVIFFGESDTKKGGAEYWVMFLIACALAFVIVSAIGSIVLGVWPQWSALLIDAIISIVAFPFVYILVKTIGRIFGLSVSKEER